MCTASVWKGKPNHSLAAKATCRVKGDHGCFTATDEPIHVDDNGVRFIGTGTDSRVLVIRDGQEVPF